MAAAARIPRLLPAGALALVAGGLGLLAGVDPGLAIVAALALAFVLVVLANLYAGVVLFILLSFLTEIPGLVGGGFTVAKFVGLLLAISWLAALTIRREDRTWLIAT